MPEDTIVKNMKSKPRDAVTSCYSFDDAAQLGPMNRPVKTRYDETMRIQR